MKKGGYQKKTEVKSDRDVEKVRKKKAQDIIFVRLNLNSYTPAISAGIIIIKTVQLFRKKKN